MELAGKKAAVLGEDGYSELELWYPVMRLREQGADVVIAGPDAAGKYASMLGYPLMPDCAIKDVDAATTDVVVIPGAEAAERLRAWPEAVKLLAAVHENGGVVAAIGDGVIVAKEAGLLDGRRITCPQGLAGQMKSAGAVVDGGAEVVDDDRLISVSQTNDLPALVRALRAHLTVATV